MTSNYRNYGEEARELVRLVLQQAMANYQRQQMAQRIEWPTGENFTIENSKVAIDAVVKVT